MLNYKLVITGQDMGTYPNTFIPSSSHVRIFLFFTCGHPFYNGFQRFTSLGVYSTLFHSNQLNHTFLRKRFVSSNSISLSVNYSNVFDYNKDH